MLSPLRLPHLVHLGVTTAGAVGLDEARHAGLTDEQICWLGESGRWQTIWPRVYAAFSGPIPLETRHHAAVMYAGEGAALSHATSGALWRLCREPADIHVCVPYEREVADQPGLKVHRSRTITAADVHPAFAPRRTTIERTFLDLVNDLDSATAALGLAADAVRGRLTNPDRLRDAILARPRTRWRRQILDALPDVRAGAHSSLELRDAEIRRRHGLPAGTRQAKRTAAGVQFLDLLIVDFGVHVELDGRLGHDRATEIWRDMRRDNSSEVAGLRHLRYGWSDLFDRPCEVAIEQAVILRQQGWPGTFRRCRRCPSNLPGGL